MTHQRTIAVFSDIEMGGGGHTDDFPHPSFLGELVADYGRGRYADRAVDVVFNGDTFDFLKLPVGGEYPIQVTSHTALAKTDAVAAAHQAFFDGVGEFLASGPGPRRVHFVVGNHDAEILFPAVRRRIRELCGDTSDRVRFPGFELAIGPVHLEHGHQYDPLFCMDASQPFVLARPEPLLNLSWAALGLLQVVIPMHPDFAFYDRLVPRDELMRLVPELTELFNALAWRYWTKDFWREFLVHKNPVFTFHWTMLKEVIRRFALTTPEVEIDQEWLQGTIAKRPAKLFISGHVHRLAHHWHAGKRIVQSGAMRDEFRIQPGGSAVTPELKTWVEVDLDHDDEAVVGLTTRERLGPPRPPQDLPDSLFDLVPLVRERLASLGDREKDGAAQADQERREVDLKRHGRGLWSHPGAGSGST